MPKAKSITIPIKDLDYVTPAITESKQVTGQWVKFKLLGDQNGQAVD
jgi:hypothetical protein